MNSNKTKFSFRSVLQQHFTHKWQFYRHHVIPYDFIPSVEQKRRNLEERFHLLENQWRLASNLARPANLFISLYILIIF